MKIRFLEMEEGAEQVRSRLLGIVRESWEWATFTQCSCCKQTAAATNKKKLQKCSGCCKVAYCSTQCQRSDWARHKSSCNYDARMLCANLCSFISNMLADCEFRRKLVQKAGGMYCLALRFNTIQSVYEFSAKGKDSNVVYNKVFDKRVIQSSNAPPLETVFGYNQQKHVAFFVEVKLCGNDNKDHYASMSCVIGKTAQDNPEIFFFPYMK